jgi:hypothetical protein
MGEQSQIIRYLGMPENDVCMSKHVVIPLFLLIKKNELSGHSNLIVQFNAEQNVSLQTGENIVTDLGKCSTCSYK